MDPGSFTSTNGASAVPLFARKVKLSSNSYFRYARRSEKLVPSEAVNVGMVVFEVEKSPGGIKPIQLPPAEVLN